MPVEKREGEQEVPSGLQSHSADAAAYLNAGRNSSRPFHQDMIEKRHAALYRCCHAHVVLLHQELNQVRLDVSVEQTLQKISRGFLPACQYIVIGGAGRNLAVKVIREKVALVFPVKRGKEIVEVKRVP